MVAAETKPQGTTFNAELDLVEAMGAEFYAHFGVGGGDIESAELQELRDDAGGEVEHTSEGESVIVARLSRRAAPASARSPSCGSTPRSCTSSRPTAARR